MVNYEIVEKECVSLSESLKILEEKSIAKELAYREEKSLEYLKKFVKLDYKNYLKAKEELISLGIPRLEEMHIIKILDIMPKTGTELRAIVSHSGTVLVDESVNKILDLLKKY